MNKFVVMAPRNVGKTTLVKKVLETTVRKTGGYYTQLYKGSSETEDKHCPVYIAPIGKEIIPDEDHCVSPIIEGRRTVNPEAFDKFGVEYLTVSDKDTLIIMDEVGFLERKAEKFKAKIFEVLASENPVLIMVKERDNIDYINRIKDFPGVTFYHMNEENRDEVFREIIKELS